MIYKEEWIKVIPYFEIGKKLVCEDDQMINKVCSPLVR